MEKEKFLHLLVVCGFMGVLWSAQEVCAEEALSPLPLETPLPEAFIPVTVLVPQAAFPFENGPGEFSTLERSSDEKEWPTLLPTGKEVVLAHLQGKFSVGTRADGIIYHPGATLTFRTERGLQNYMSWGKGGENPLFLTEEEKIALGFKFAETVTESVQALPIPFVGSLLAGCLQIGHNVDDVTRGIRKKYRLHLNYSEKTFRAAYKESF